MKLRHIKRATQRRMFSLSACVFRAFGLLRREMQEDMMRAIKHNLVLPDRLSQLIANIDPEPLSPEAFRELVEAMPHKFPGSSATPDGA